MSIVMEMPFAIKDLEKVFEISEFLENKKELAKIFKPDVEKYLVRSDFFKGTFKIVYKKAFDELISKLIKTQVTNHFTSWTPEEILILCDKDFLKIIASDLFDPNYYKNIN